MPSEILRKTPFGPRNSTNWFTKFTAFCTSGFPIEQESTVVSIQSLAIFELILDNFDFILDIAEFGSGQLNFPWTNRWGAADSCNKKDQPDYSDKKRSYFWFFLPWQFDTFRKDTSGNLSLSYFKLIDLERTHQSFDVYRIDFEMFNYSVNEYLNIFL